MLRTVTVAAIAALCLWAGGCTGDGEGFSLDKTVKSMLPTPPKEVIDRSLPPHPADVRRDALYTMSRWKEVDDGLVGLVGLALLGESDDMARAQAARTLGSWGRPSAVPYLSVALAGRIDGVSFPEAEKELVEMDVKLPSTPDRSKFVRHDAAGALGGIRTDEAVLSLVRGLQYDADGDVRIECARQLRHHKHIEAARGLLLGLVDRDLAVRTISLESLEFMTAQKFGNDIDAWDKFLRESEAPLADYGHKVEVYRTSARWIDLSEDRKAKIREIFTDLFPLERKEGPFD